jgi:PAS domain S-box-containing protein
MIPIREPLRRMMPRALAVFRSLRFKATVAVASINVMISLLLATLFVLYVERIERTASSREAQSIAELFARDATAGIAAGDIAQIDEAIGSAMQSASVLYASASDLRGEIARRESDGAADVRSVLPVLDPTIPPAHVQVDPRRDGGESPLVLDVVAPVLSSSPERVTIGAVRVAYSLAPTMAKTRELRWRAASIALTMILLGTAGTTFLVRALIGPIQDLARATERVADGDFTTRMESPSDDELGVLTRSFNEMTLRLEKARDRQETWSREMENRVREKTREIEETRRHLMNIVENVGASVIVADLDGTVVSANSPTTKIFGIKPEWIVGRSLQEFTCDPDRRVAELRRLLEDGGTVVYEAEFVLDENRTMDLLVTHSLLRDPDGRASGILQITKDITPLKMMERRLLDSERLSAMGEMAGEIGHELNNYLTAIGGRAELIPMALERGNHDLVRQNSTIIAEQVARMRVLTDGLLDSARKETSPIDIDLHETIERAVEFARPQNKFNDIKVSVTGPQNPMPVRADPQQITQVILNLLVNAADAILAKGNADGSIRVECFQRAGETGFRVIDDGVGIDEKTIARIFEPRFTTKKSGHGFGLAVCYRVVRDHGGEIVVDSHPGRGSTFTVTLPPRPASHASASTASAETALPRV